MELIAKIKGREVAISVESDGLANFQVMVDDQCYELSCREVVPNLYALLLGPSSYEVRVSDPSSSGLVEAQLREDSYEIELTDPMKRLLGETSGRGALGEVAVESVMPGKVLRVSVAEGDQVEEGQKLVVLVAMKMENDIESPKSGVVKSVHVKEGDSVDSGSPLVTIA